ncbi:MAG: recombinase family protein, partial [Clostridia bacterium]|nr:recombinase family protein [Clostridia bacterium]
PNDDDWLKIQFQFLINEMPVTDTSKKVRAVVRRRQQDGKWICAAPYGYIINNRQQFEVVPTEAEIVRTIFRLYREGWGYKKIANHLTDEGIPTPRMSEKQRKEAEGLDYKREAKPIWSIATVSGILQNDFYIGTMRAGKYTRQKINGKDIPRDESEQIVIENHHQAIISYREFATVKAQMESRSSAHYRGQKKYDNVYSGFLVCGDCGSPMFSMSRPELKDAYRCGLYHRRGTKACTSHYIQVAKLDALLKSYIQKVTETSADMLEQLNSGLAQEDADLQEADRSEDNLAQVLEDLQEELKATKRQRIRDITKHPEREAMLEELYDEMEEDLAKRITGIQNQIELTTDRKNTIIRVNRAAKLAMEVFDEILRKDKLDREDLHLIIEKIKVYEDRLDIQLKPDIDSLLRCGTLPAEQEDAVNFKQGMKNIEDVTIVQRAEKRPDKVFHVNVISDGDPLEIYTDADGEVIFKKYSPIGELSAFTEQYADVLFRGTGLPVVMTDRDQAVACAGVPKKEVLDRRVSAALEQLMEQRAQYICRQDSERMRPIDGMEREAAAAFPIVGSGDVSGAVVLLLQENGACPTQTEIKLAQIAASFLGKQTEG